jgi:hypothetical protein
MEQGSITPQEKMPAESLCYSGDFCLVVEFGVVAVRPCGNLLFVKVDFIAIGCHVPPRSCLLRHLYFVLAALNED